MTSSFSDLIELMAGVPEAPEILWHHAWGALVEDENPRPMIELLRRHMAPPAYYCDVLADLLDPAKTDYGQLSFRKSKAFLDLEQTNHLLSMGDMVLQFEEWGEKRYVAVQKVAARMGVTERYVWKALRKRKDFDKEIAAQYEAEAGTEQD
jgi:hypothetical protein